MWPLRWLIPVSPGEGLSLSSDPSTALRGTHLIPAQYVDTVVSFAFTFVSGMCSQARSQASMPTFVACSPASNKAGGWGLGMRLCSRLCAKPSWHPNLMVHCMIITCCRCTCVCISEQIPKFDYLDLPFTGGEAQPGGAGRPQDCTESGTWGIYIVRVGVLSVFLERGPPSVTMSVCELWLLDHHLYSCFTPAVQHRVNAVFQLNVHVPGLFHMACHHSSSMCTVGALLNCAFMSDSLAGGGPPWWGYLLLSKVISLAE